ncbi:MAG: hypothetical protein MMC33_010508 [Icmadophila ericetorum]|nr:hypothetical protein [Icmadophila ericetorum]
MAPGLHQFLNTPSCLRKAGLLYFQDETYGGNPPKAVPIKCCSNCHPTEKILRSARPQPQSKLGDIVWIPWRVQQSKKWRAHEAGELFKKALVTSSFKPKRLLQVLMPDETLNLIAKWGNHITDTKSLRQWSGQWPESDRYCTNIIAVVAIPAGWTRLTDNEGTALWKAQNGRKKRKVPPTPDSDDEFQAERNAWLSLKGYSNIHKRPRANAKPKTQRTQDSTQLQESQLQQESQFQLMQRNQTSADRN